MRCRRLAYLGLLLWMPLSAVLLSGCHKAPDPWEGLGGPPRVVVSFAPLYSFVKSVGGDHVGVRCVCREKDPHEFTYEPEQAVQMRNADLLVAVGLNLDAGAAAGGKAGFADQLYANGGKPNLPFLKLGNAIPKDLLRKTEDGKSDDPHIWLGVKQARACVFAVRDRLNEIDPGHKADYDRNAADLADRITRLGKSGEEKLAGKRRQMLTSHDALRYFAESFELTVIPIKEDPESALDGKALADLVEKMTSEQDPIGVIAIEPNNDTARSDAERLKAEAEKKVAQKRKDRADYLKGYEVRIVEIDPLETVGKDEELTADWYLKRMQANIDKLAEALPNR